MRPTTSSRSTPRSRAKWFRVPAGMHANGRSCSAAMVATSACVPSPPAAASASAPRATASRTTCSPVVAGAQLDRFDASRPRLRVEVRSCGLAPAGPGVPDHHRSSRPLSGRQCNMDPERPPSGDSAEPEEHDGHERLGQNPSGHQYREGGDQQEPGEHHQHGADSARPSDGLPHGDEGQRQHRGHDQTRGNARLAVTTSAAIDPASRTSAAIAVRRRNLIACRRFTIRSPLHWSWRLSVRSAAGEAYVTLGRHGGVSHTGVRDDVREISRGRVDWLEPVRRRSAGGFAGTSHHRQGGNRHDSVPALGVARRHL